MDFDEYFGRFRCLASDCGWMLPSTTEREIRRLQSRKQPTTLASVTIPELDLTLTPSYDEENDVISIDFGLDEPTIDLPEPDGKMIWRIGRHTDRVAGFAIMGAREGALSKIDIQFIIRRKNDIESRLPRFPSAIARGRVTRHLIDEIIVTAVTAEEDASETAFQGEEAWKDIVHRLSDLTTA
jgi:hypothetical protein